MATDNETPCQHIMGDRNFIRKVVDRFGIHADGWNPTIGNIRSVLLRKGDCACDSFFRIAFMDFCQRAIAREDVTEEFITATSEISRFFDIFRCFLASFLYI